MKLALTAFVPLLFACAPAPQEPTPPSEPPRMESLASEVAAETEPALYVIQLPAGDVPGWSIDMSGWTGHDVDHRYYSSHAAQLRASSPTAAPGSYWLDVDADGNGVPDYGGVAFRGQGADATHVRPALVAGRPIDDTVVVASGPERVQIDGLTIHCGSTRGIFFGLQNTAHATPDPKFRLNLFNAKVVADPPPADSQRSTKWGIFGYQSDVHLRDVTLDILYSAEHASYWHGFASPYGLVWERVKIPHSGAEGCKVRNDPSETVWVRGAKIYLSECDIRDWFQTWSDRGGAGAVFQGPGCSVYIDRCAFVGNPGERGRCIMIDDGSGAFYNALDGRVGVGPAVGYVVVQRTAMYAPGVGASDYRQQVMRCGTLVSSTHVIARALSIYECGIYGDHYSVQISNLLGGTGSLTGCNTPTVAAFCQRLGIDTSVEAAIPRSTRVAKVSEGASW